GAAGTLFAGSFVSHLASGATNYFTVSGAEIDVGIETGGSAKNRLGWAIVGTGAGASAPLGTALGKSAAGRHITTGLLVSSLLGFMGVGTTGTLLGTDGVGATVAHGIDWSAFTFSTDAIKTPGYTLDGAGNISARTQTLTVPTSTAALNINDGSV